MALVAFKVPPLILIATSLPVASIVEESTIVVPVDSTAVLAVFIVVPLILTVAFVLTIPFAEDSIFVEFFKFIVPASATIAVDVVVIDDEDISTFDDAVVVFTAIDASIVESSTYTVPLSA